MLKSWRFWIGLLISAACLYVAFQGIQFDRLLQALAGINYAWLVVASGLFGISYSGRVFRWQLLFSPLRLRLGKIFNALNIGYFLSNILPARIGDFVRAYLIGDIEGVSKALALSTIIVERMSDGLTVVLLLAITAIFVPNIPIEARQGAIVTAIVGVVAVFILLLLSFQKERGLGLLRSLTAPFSFLQRPRLWSAIESLIDGFAVLRSPRPLVGVGAWALFAWIVGGLMYWVVMQAMNSPELELPISAAYLVMTVTSLVVVLPSSPGYIGVFHYFAVLTLTTVFGVDKNIALSYAVVMHAFTYIWLIILGVFSMWHEGMSYQRLQSIEIQAVKD